MLHFMKTQSEEKKCKNFLLALVKANHKFFKIDPYYPKTSTTTFLNYMDQRQEGNERYELPKFNQT